MNWFKSSSIWDCHTLWMILTLLFQKLEGFILVWKTTFWLELFFINTLGHCEWHIRMHILMSCQNSLFDRQKIWSNLGQKLFGCKQAQFIFVISSSFAWFCLKILWIVTTFGIEYIEPNFYLKLWIDIKFVGKRLMVFEVEGALKLTYVLSLLACL
jgi:hypothetical protein